MPRRTTHLWTACGSCSITSHNSQCATVQWQTTQGMYTEFEGYHTGRDGEKAFWKKLQDISKSRLATKFACLFLRCNQKVSQMLIRYRLSGLNHKVTLLCLFAQKSFSPKSSTYTVLKRCYIFIVTSKFSKYSETLKVVSWDEIIFYI